MKGRDEIRIRLEIVLDYLISLVQKGGREIDTHEDTMGLQQIPLEDRRGFSQSALLPGPSEFIHEQAFFIDEMANRIPVVPVPYLNYIGTSENPVSE